MAFSGLRKGAPKGLAVIFEHVAVLRLHIVGDGEVAVPKVDAATGRRKPSYLKW